MCVCVYMLCLCVWTSKGYLVGVILIYCFYIAHFITAVILINALYKKIATVISMCFTTIKHHNGGQPLFHQPCRGKIRGTCSRNNFTVEKTDGYPHNAALLSLCVCVWVCSPSQLRTYSEPLHSDQNEGRSTICGYVQTVENCIIEVRWNNREKIMCPGFGPLFRAEKSYTRCVSYSCR